MSDTIFYYIVIGSRAPWSRWARGPGVAGDRPGGKDAFRR